MLTTLPQVHCDFHTLEPSSFLPFHGTDNSMQHVFWTAGITLYYFIPNMRYNLLMLYFITPKGNLLSPTMHFNIQTLRYQLWQLSTQETWLLTTVKYFRGKKPTKLCSCVTPLAYYKSILNFITEVENSACTGDTLNYGHIRLSSSFLLQLPSSSRNSGKENSVSKMIYHWHV